MPGSFPFLRKALLIAAIVLNHGVASAERIYFEFVVEKPSTVTKITLKNSAGKSFQTTAFSPYETGGGKSMLYPVDFPGEFEPDEAEVLFEDRRIVRFTVSSLGGEYDVPPPPNTDDSIDVSTDDSMDDSIDGSTDDSIDVSTDDWSVLDAVYTGLFVAMLVVLVRIAIGVAAWLLWMMDGVNPPPDWPFALTDAYRQLRPHRKFASGGMADVWSAQLTSRFCMLGLGWSGKVAVKILKQGLFADKRIREAFHAEARFLIATARTDVVPRVRCTCDPDFQMPFFAMDSLEKMNRLRDKIGGPGRNTTDTPGAFPVFALRMGHALFETVDRIHRAGCAHLDVSPENVMYVIGRNRGIRIMLIDFGMAKAIPEVRGPASYVAGGDFTGLGCGRPDYSAPEMLKDWGLADFRSDAYSAGVVLWECIFGEVPGRKHQHAPQKLVACGISEPLAAAIVQLLSLEPESRPSVRAVAELIKKELGRRHG
jgi:hypothetical protein